MSPPLILPYGFCCRGPARTRAANACQLVHGVLLEFRSWAKSAGVLHAAVDCLKQCLKLTATGVQYCAQCGMHSWCFGVFASM